MRDWFKNHKYATLFLLFATVAIAAGVPEKIPSDSLTLGVGSSSDDKVLTIDVGDGASNPNITVDTTNKDFDLNKALNVTGTLSTTDDATVGGDTLTVGSGAGADQSIILDRGGSNPVIRWNEVSSRLQFTNDGTNFKNIGSGAGAGGGTNFLVDDNFDFEAGITSWSPSALSVGLETTTPLDGDSSGTYDANALGQTVDSNLVPIKSLALGNKCQMEVIYRYASGASGDYSFVARQFDDSGALESDVAIVPVNVTGTGRGTAFIAFDCPDDVNDDLRVRLISNVADPGLIVWDNAFIGTGKNSIQVSQASLYGTANFDGATNCSWSLTTTSYADFPVDADCNLPTTTGGVSAAGTKIPGIVLNDLPPGEYKIIAIGTFGTNSTLQWGHRLTDGTTPAENNSQNNQNSSVNVGGTSQVIGTFTYTASQPSVTIRIQGFSGSNSSFVQALSTTEDLNFLVYRYPLNSVESLNLETIGQSWAGYHDNTCDWSGPGAGFADFNADASCSLIKREGSIPILTSDDGADPLPGIKWTPGRTEKYKVCAQYGMNGTSNAVVAHRMINVTNSKVIVNQEIRIQTNSASMGEPLNMCGIVQGVAGELIDLRIQGAVGVGSTAIRSIEVSFGESAIEWSVFPIDQSLPAPIFTEVNEKMGADLSGMVTRACRIDNVPTTPSVIGDTSICGWISSLVDSGTAATTVNYVGAFSAKPICVCSSGGAGTADGNTCVIDVASTYDENTLRIFTHDSASTAETEEFNLVCVGRR